MFYQDIQAFVSSIEPATHDESKYNCLSNLYIEKKIGKGQFSEVYRAKCLVDNETVALKKIQVFVFYLSMQFLISHAIYFLSFPIQAFSCLCIQFIHFSLFVLDNFLDVK